MSDAWLEGFFAEIDKRPALSDAIVVVVGDHSFPIDEHNNHFNGLTAYEEVFRTGFMLRWPGHVLPERVSNRAASQIDIAPTITDLAGLHFQSQFVGQSLFAGEPAQPVVLVQPYDGVRLVALKWPFKLVHHEASEDDTVFDLERDPNEVGMPVSADVSELRHALGRLRANQAILKGDRVWPR